MLLVSDVYSEVQRVMGDCDDASVFNRISDATEVLCNKTDIDPLIGWVDIVTTGGKAITLPREVDTVLALNISGVPSFPRNRWAEFHLNGLGSDASDQGRFFWDDKGDYPLFKDPEEPVQFTALAAHAGDVAEGEIWVHGYDFNDRKVTSEVDGAVVDGWKVPLSGSLEGPAPDAPVFKRVTGVRKKPSLGYVSLYGTTSGGDVALYGDYEPSETLPQYRRILLSTSACWARIQYRRKVFRVTSQTDRIPLHSRMALMLMCKALQKYDNDKIEEGDLYERKAVALLVEKQLASNPPSSPSIQISETTTLVGHCDRMT